MFANENCLVELQDTEFKRTIINVIKEFKEVKEDPKKHLHEVKQEEFRANKCLNDAPQAQTLADGNEEGLRLETGTQRGNSNAGEDLT